MTSPSFTSTAAPVFGKSTLAALVTFAAITPLVLLVAPAVAAQLGVQLGLSASEIGTYFFVELGAFSCATLPSYLWLGRMDARRVAAFSLAIFCLGNLLTALLMPGFAALLALRAVTALGGGTLMVLCMTSAATSKNHDRTFGLWVVGQLVAGAVGLFLLPYLFSAYGLRSFYVALAALGAIAAPLCRGFDTTRPDAARGAAIPQSQSISIAILAIAGVLAFYIAIGGVWTFASAAATNAGLNDADTGKVLSVATIMGIVGALIASFIGSRVERKAMLIAGYAILAVSLIVLATHPTATGYSIAVFAFKFAWTFVLPLILAVVAKSDGTGRLVASLTLVIGLGLAVGPLIAGVMLDTGWGLGSVFVAATVACLISLAFLFHVERKGQPDRA
ncbi:MFS transporter [Rhizobium lusitanum]|uniref:MFS transporter n=1 Tax=Rhizobium lusitanum TaxID=293958 RepID=UPI00195BD685|nr:MFS transporter [Rhizobium lusitanum]MBM7048412.1 MFS transporter [Rhizobium lusitanum]